MLTWIGREVNMANFDLKSFSEYLGNLDFRNLFTQVLGWNNPPKSEQSWQEREVKETLYQTRMIAELAGVAVLEVVTADAFSDENLRMAIWRQISQSHYENLLIFIDATNKPAQSLWYWVKRTKDKETNKPKVVPRRHEYFRGQPIDLFASKLRPLLVELSELDESGRLPVLEVARRMESALNVEKTTKRFFIRYQEQHQSLLESIEGIDNDRDRRWYASVILNRLMFVWFLQKKLFLNGGDPDYLDKKIKESKVRGHNLFYAEFLKALFFEAFAKPENQRSDLATKLTGKIPYLNGGLFLPHKLEQDEQHEICIGKTLNIKDTAFDGVFEVFKAFSWHLDDTPAGQSDEINPDVLGYIFEKYINQKAFGAYYTKPEITNYLAERSIHQLVLERINSPAFPELNLPAIDYHNIAELLAHMDAKTALRLVNEVLPSITILDPAVGSGAFLVAALKALINIYYAVVGRAELGASAELQTWLKAIQKDHPSVGYYIKRRIVTDNLYGADIMEEACEIAKLRLFLAMVSSVRKVEDLEPLPNIDFNIIAGNSLVGLMRVDEHEFNSKQDDLFKSPFRKLLEDKNRKLDTYRHTASDYGKATDLRALRDDIDAEMDYAKSILNELLRDQFEGLGVKFEQATWDSEKQELGKFAKRKIETSDIAKQTPLHWGYVFDEVMHKRGGFDIVLTNPPWEVFQTNQKEYFLEIDSTIKKKKLAIEDWENQFSNFMSDPEIRESWLNYVSKFPHVQNYYKKSPDYPASSATGAKLNLYMLFLERCLGLMRTNAYCGIVIPSGIYTDLGAKGLRDLLFNHSHIKGLFCFENRKTIFEGVDSRFKFVVLTFEKSSTPRLQQLDERNASAPPNDLLANQDSSLNGTVSFPAAFMRHEVSELEHFPEDGGLWLDVDLIKRLSPDSHSVMEFKSQLDIQIAKKLLKYPMLSDKNGWAINLYGEELNMTRSSSLFKGSSDDMPVYEGGMIWQFDSSFAEPRYRVNEHTIRDNFKQKRSKRITNDVPWENLKNDYEAYRICIRKIASNTNERTLISSLMPKYALAGNSLTVHFPFSNSSQCENQQNYTCVELLFLISVINSFVLDYFLRSKMTTNLNLFYLYQLPLPKPNNSHYNYLTISLRAAKLICTNSDFDGLAKDIGLKPNASGGGSPKYGISEPIARGKIRSELDGLIAHLYGLTETEFAHILTTFPLVQDSVKLAALNAYRDIDRGLLS